MKTDPATVNVWPGSAWNGGPPERSRSRCGWPALPRPAQGPEFRRETILRHAQGRRERSRTAKAPPQSPVAARSPRQGLGRRNGQALAPFGATTLEDVSSVLRGHSHQEAVGAPPAAAVRLKRAFTLHNSRTPARRKNAGENLDSSEPSSRVSNKRRVSAVVWRRCGPYVRVASLRLP